MNRLLFDKWWMCFTLLYVFFLNFSFELSIFSCHFLWVVPSLFPWCTPLFSEFPLQTALSVLHPVIVSLSPQQGYVYFSERNSRTLDHRIHRSHCAHCHSWPHSKHSPFHTWFPHRYLCFNFTFTGSWLGILIVKPFLRQVWQNLVAQYESQLPGLSSQVTPTPHSCFAIGCFFQSLLHSLVLSDCFLIFLVMFDLGLLF